MSDDPDLSGSGWTPAKRRHLTSEVSARPGRFDWAPPLNWRAGLIILLPAVVILGWWLMRANATAPQQVPARTAAVSPTGMVSVSSPPGAGPTASPTVLFVHVVGAVAKPGLVQVNPGSRVAEAIEQAGGVSGKADLTQVNLARPLTDGEQIVVPKPGQSVAAAASNGGAGAGGGSGPATSGVPGAGGSAGAVDLNQATLSDLDALPGIGPVLAQRIIDFRGSNGGFRSVDELSDVPGIGDKVMANLRPLVRV